MLSPAAPEPLHPHRDIAASDYVIAATATLLNSSITIYNLPLLSTNPLLFNNVSAISNPKISSNHDDYSPTNISLVSKLSFPSPHKTPHIRTSSPNGPSPFPNIKSCPHRRTHTHPSAPYLHLASKLSLPRSHNSLYASFLILSDPLSPPLSKPLQCISPNPP